MESTLNLDKNQVDAKQLALSFPPPVYYSLFAADKLSMICLNDSAYNWMYNNFIQLLFYKKYLKDPAIVNNFFKSQYIGIWPIDSFKMGQKGANLFLDEIPINDHFMALTKETLIDQLIKWMNEDYYVIANIDVSKLSTTHYYGDTPFCHSSLITGYDNNAKVLKQVDYGPNGAINLVDIPYEDYIAAFFSPDLERIFKNDKKMDVKYYMTLYKLKPNVKVELDPSIMKFWIKEFIDCESSNKKFNFFVELGETIGGFDVYKAVLDMSQLLFDVNKGNIDYRMYHAIYEHKKIMDSRLKALEEHKYLDPALNLVAENEKLVKLAEKMRYTVLKNNIGPNARNLKQLNEFMQRLVDIEHTVMTTLYEKL